MVPMLDSNFWESPELHVAANPHSPGDAEGVAAFALSRGMARMCFFQTSGSEGRPKWVGLSKESFLISGAAVNAHFEITPEDRWLVALPLHHVGGFAIYARAYLSKSMVIRSRSAKWQTREFVNECRNERISLVSLVPTQVYDLVRDRLECPSPLRAAIIGGGGMTQALADQAAALGWRVFQSYGMTEAASQIATQPYNPFGPTYDVGSLEVLPHWQLDQDDLGRLIVRGVALARGYAQRGPGGEWGWDAIDPDKGLTTRDLVRLWTHGTRRFLSFVGREAGYVKILGELVHLAPLQAKLEELALAAGWPLQPVLVALPDQRKEARLAIIHEGRDEGLVQDLVSSFNAQTPPLCQVDTVMNVPEIPRTPVGKVDTPALLKLLTRA